MKLQKEAVPNGIWAGTAEGYDLLSSKLELLSNAAGQAQPGFSMVHNIENVAVLTVDGPLVTGTGAPEWGIYGYDDIRTALIDAAEDPSTSSIMLYMNTPGGSAMGVDDLGKFIQTVSNTTKPVHAYTDSQCCSGGYWLASYADSFSSSELATVGSIGVIAMTNEITDALAQDGVTVHVIKSTPLKAIGNRYEKLSEEGKALISSEVSFIHSKFAETVAANRNLDIGYVSTDLAIGRTWFGSEASTNGLIDHVLSYDSMVKKLSEEFATRSELAYTANKKGFNIPEVTNMKKKVLTDKAQAMIASGVSEDEAINEAGEEHTQEVDEVTTEPSEGTKEGEAEASASVTSSFSVDSLISQLVEAKAEKKQLEVEHNKLQALVGDLKDIAVEALRRMSVGLGGAPIDASGSDIASLVHQYHQINTAFTQRYPVGRRVAVKTEDDSPEQSEEVVNERLLKLTKITNK